MNEIEKAFLTIRTRVHGGRVSKDDRLRLLLEALFIVMGGSLEHARGKATCLLEKRNELWVTLREAKNDMGRWMRICLDLGRFALYGDPFGRVTNLLFEDQLGGALRPAVGEDPLALGNVLAELLTMDEVEIPENMDQRIYNALARAFGSEHHSSDFLIAHSNLSKSR